MSEEFKVGDRVEWHDIIGGQWLPATITEALYMPDGRRYYECLADGYDAAYGKHYGWPEDFKEASDDQD